MFSEFRNSYGKNCSSVGRKENTCTAVKLSIAYKVSVWWLPWIPGDKLKEFVRKNRQVWQNSDPETLSLQRWSG